MPKKLKPGKLVDGIIKRSRGRYTLVLELGYETDLVTGARKRKQKWQSFRAAPGTRETTADKQARARRIQLLNEINSGTFIDQSSVTVIEFLRSWLESSVKPPMRRPATYNLYRTIVENHVARRALGAMLIQKVRPSDIERYLGGLTKAAPATVALHYSVLHSAFRRAVRDRLVVATPMIEIERRKPSRDARRIRARAQCWSLDEVRAVLDAAAEAGTQVAAFFALALDTGARKGELLGLAWSHVNLDDATVTIERQITSRRGVPTFGPTKTDKARVLDVDANTVARLRAHKAAQAEMKMRNRMAYQDLGLVFAKEPADLQTRHAALGEPMTGILDGRHFRAVVRAAGVRPITVHGMRHTVATALLSAGRPVHEVAELLGHAKPSMTLDVYAHAMRPSGTQAGSRRSPMGGVLYR